MVVGSDVSNSPSPAVAAPAASQSGAAGAGVTQTATAAAATIGKGATALASSVARGATSLFGGAAAVLATHPRATLDLAPWRHIGGLIPRPAPGAAFPGVKTPDETFANWLQSQQDTVARLERAQQQDAEAARNVDLTAAQRAMGALRAASGASDKSVKSVTEKATIAARERSLQQDQDLFQHQFPQFASSTLLGLFECDALQNGRLVHGYLAATTTHLAFVSKSSPVKETLWVGNPTNGATIRFACAWTDVALLQPGASMPTTDGTPYIAPLPDDIVKVDALNVVFRDKQVFGFAHIRERDDLGRQAVWATSSHQYADARSLIAVVDRAWRAVGAVPREGVQYAA